MTNTTGSAIYPNGLRARALLVAGLVLGATFAGPFACDPDEDELAELEAVEGFAGESLDAAAEEGSVGEISPESVEADAEVTLIPLTADEARRLRELNGEEPDASVVGGLFVLNEVMTDDEIEDFRASILAPVADTLTIEPTPSEWCTGRYLTNVTLLSNSVYFPGSPLETTAAWGPKNLGLSVNRTVSASYSTNLGVSASVVSASVGYGVTSSYGVSSSTSMYVPNGKLGTLRAYTSYKKHRWNVWDDPCVGSDKYIGVGYSFKPNGVYFESSLK